MDRLNYHFGMIINGEFHNIKIDESPSPIDRVDPPYVGRPQSSKKVNFNDYSDGQLIVVGTNWRSMETKTVGKIPADLMPIVFNTRNLLPMHKRGLEFKHVETEHSPNS